MSTPPKTLFDYQKPEYQKPDKFLITSTGRSGTTFLILIYILLDQPSNYNKQTYDKELKRFFISNCGLEGNWNDPGVFIKNPNFLMKIPEIQKNTNLKGIVFPYRDFKSSAESRAILSRRTPNGGLWNAKDVPSQIEFYNKIYKTFLLDTTRFKIPVIYVDFERLIKDPIYTYQVIHPTFQQTKNKEPIHFEKFLLAYYQATDIHHRKSPRVLLTSPPPP